MGSQQNNDGEDKSSLKLSPGYYTVSIGLEGKTIWTFHPYPLKQNKNKKTVAPKPVNPKFIPPKTTVKKAKLKKPAPEDTHKKFIEDAGLYIYEYARSQGYSVYGATLFLALAAQESGYGNAKALDKFMGLNNFFGINAGKRKFNTREEGVGYQLDKDTGLIHRKYHLLDSLLKQDNPDISQLDKGFKGYNLDSNGVNYASWLSNNVLKGVTKRTIADISDEILAIKAQIDNKEQGLGTEKPIFWKSTPFTFTMSDEDMSILESIKGLKAKMKELEGIKHELETGHGDTNPFLAPKSLKDYKKQKKLGNSDNLGTPSLDIPAYTPDFMRTGIPMPQAVNGFSGMGLSSSPAQSNTLSNYFINPPSIMPKSALSSPVMTPNILSPSNLARPNASQSRGGAPVNNIKYQTNDNHNHTSTSPNDIYAQVAAVLSSAVADSKIGGFV